MNFKKLTKPRAVGRSPKCIRKTPARRIQKSLRNINWCSCYELFKTGKLYTFLVSFMILASRPKWSRSCFATRYKIFSNITHQSALSEPRPNVVPFFFSEYALENLLAPGRYLCPGLTFDFIRQRKEVKSSRGSLFKLSSR